MLCLLVADSFYRQLGLFAFVMGKDGVEILGCVLEDINKVSRMDVSLLPCLDMFT